MNLSDLLGTSFACQCGKQHTVPTQYLYYQQDAFKHLANTANLITPGKTYLVFSDVRTFDVAGRAVVAELQKSGARVDHFSVPDKDGESPATDDLTRDLLMNEAPQADLYIAVGSGVINDLVKWVAFLREKPYLVVATAASMNGYASANVAATIEGLKVLFHAEAAKAVFTTPEIIINAPAELSTSGLGDVLAKSVSSSDWKLNQFLFQDYYCQFSVDLLKDLEPIYLEDPEKIRDHDPAGYRALFHALFYSSVAMTITGTSSPASGGEHLISHTLDMLAGRDQRQHDYHGRQVGVASILMAALYEKVMAIEQPLFRKPVDNVNQAFWGNLTSVVEKEYKKKLPKLEQVAGLLAKQENWHNLRQLIKPNLIAAAKLKHCLMTAGAAHRYADIRVDGQPLTRATFVAVVSHAYQMRERFTILDLAVMLGIIPDGIEELIDGWVA